MENQIELRFLRDRNMAIMAELEETKKENAELRRKMRSLQITLSKSQHPARGKDA